MATTEAGEPKPDLAQLPEPTWDDRCVDAYKSALELLVDSSMAGFRTLIKQKSEERKRQWFFVRHWKVGVFILMAYFAGYPAV